MCQAPFQTQHTSLHIDYLDRCYLQNIDGHCWKHHLKQQSLSRLLEEPSLATTLKGVYFIHTGCGKLATFFIWQLPLPVFYRRYMFRPLLAIFRLNTQFFQEDGQQGPKNVAAIKYKKNKHLLKLLRGTVLLLTLITRATGFRTQK
jgi:hypothetical protein